MSQFFSYLLLTFEFIIFFLVISKEKKKKKEASVAHHESEITQRLSHSPPLALHPSVRFLLPFIFVSVYVYD